MIHSGISPSSYTFTSVIKACADLSVLAWNSMISGYEQNGLAKEAIGEVRLGLWVHDYIVINGIRVNVVLGLVHEGRQASASMRKEYGLLPGVEHHVAMVDLLGRAGFLNEAYKSIRVLSHEELVPPVWTAMLGACKMHKNFDLGVEVAEHLLSVEPENPGHYVMFSIQMSL
ncbi:Pentatricopeptide repeat-containing protein [Quillaja saponaria]|uniref:Pentatricopeptide repeat-containing protein n=1 Tax=Quillaja saponaria TaxID=32244 RepID=A0AAD7KXL5_QUISA|nr:Pentatricopeptide repeat-containing protein [Quillaja saponaria]